MSGAGLDDAAFDRTLVEAALDLAATDGWRGVAVARAARNAGLPLDRARSRFPDRLRILLALGELADRAALEGSDAAGVGGADVLALPPRELLFDALMRRFDVLQTSRAGVIAVLHALPFDPLTALVLGSATNRSMAWMLESAGIGTAGLRGALRVQLLTGAWLHAVRAWEKDTSPDLAGTMAALDRGLDRIGMVDAVFAAAAPAGGLPPGPPPGPPGAGAAEGETPVLPPDP